MGYRNYISSIKKKDFVDCRQLWDYDDGVITNLYELGKYIDNEVREGLITIGESDSDDGEFCIIDIESIPVIISHFSKKHINFLNSVKSGESRQFTLESYIDDQIRQWSRPESFIYNINKDYDALVNSWEYQYEIFDLIRIYKTFDVENNYLLWLDINEMHAT